MSAELHDPHHNLSVSLTNAAKSITEERVTLKQLLELIGEQGMLLFVTFLMVPFLLPVSIPGVSTVFSLVVILVGVGVTLNRVPWLPARLMNRSFATETLVAALERGAKMMERVDKIIRPRLPLLTHGATINRLNGLMLIVSGILLIFPLGGIPLSNTLPAIAVVLLSVGMIQRDGFFIVLGYLAVFISIAYFIGLGVLVISIGGEGFRRLLGSGFIYLPFLNF